MPSEHDAIEYSENERRLLDLLPRESELDAASEDRLIDALRAEGHFKVQRPRWRPWVQAAAALALLLLGAWAGFRIGQRGSLEASMSRSDLSASDRVLMLQRAGTLYVRAANEYASATAQTDSTAVEVASQVLIGAAQALARSGLDGGITPELTTVLRRGTAAAVPTRQPTLWF